MHAILANLRKSGSPVQKAEGLPFDHLDVLVLDGKSLKKVAKRLVETRGTPGKLLGAKLLVAYRPRDGPVLDMASDSTAKPTRPN